MHVANYDSSQVILRWSGSAQHSSLRKWQCILRNSSAAVLSHPRQRCSSLTIISATAAAIAKKEVHDGWNQPYLVAPMLSSIKRQLDYCNAIYRSISDVAYLQSVQNAATSLLPCVGLGWRKHVTPAVPLYNARLTCRLAKVCNSVGDVGLPFASWNCSWQSVQRVPSYLVRRIALSTFIY